MNLFYKMLLFGDPFFRLHKSAPCIRCCDKNAKSAQPDAHVPRTTISFQRLGTSVIYSRFNCTCNTQTYRYRIVYHRINQRGCKTLMFVWHRVTKHYCSGRKGHVHSPRHNND
uniref:Putative uncharacterized protein YOR379C n=1 Tax=Saccharomyces cerevisiae (strain ATCC 204508 / S288c) TaxID=559292 RepID=YO379_YEAST|nr:RecName: Full=Putative uncharacterized protein YOR379C [Saccharomyces cerevisiae S288C]CAA99710.1 unnamed protein product [Saccharomyces cerevisiae]